MIQIESLRQTKPEDIVCLGELSRELHEDDRELTVQDLNTMIGDPNIILMVIKDNERIIGMGTLYVIQKLGKRSAYVEDVIVDSGYRGQGLGKRLMGAILAEAKKRGVQSISLMSQSKRIAANKLYESVGFVKRETNVYRLSLS